MSVTEVTRNTTAGTDDIRIPAIASDGSLYPVEKMDAHRRGLQHLAISAFVFSGDALLIQRRAQSKYHCGGLWANTVCTHPNWGEAIEDCVPRRLCEELGIAVPMSRTRVLDYHADVGGGLIENERVHVFRGTADRHRLAIHPNPDEVAETRWVSLAHLDDEVGTHPERFTPWFRIYLNRWAELAV
jgi:isopentenyl-diphosphate delta-isomerase